MADEFGLAESKVLLADFALLELGDRSANALLAAGEDPGVIWLAICRAQGVPKERQAGLDKKAKKGHAEG